MLRKLLPIVVLYLLSSCQFSEECKYTGNVELIMDWESLWGNLQKPESLNALFYKEGDHQLSKVILGDTIYQNIPAGDTELITYNHPSEIKFEGDGTSSNAEIHLPTYFEGNIRAVKESPMICSTNGSFIVPIEGTIKHTIIPHPIVKQLNFVVKVIKEGKVGNIKSCRASLSGISTGYSLSTRTPIRSKATVFFPLESNGKEDTFKHNFFVLGVNPDLPGEESIANKLVVTILLDDGETKSSEIELSDKFNLFSDNIFTCQVDITISALSTDIIISDWEQGNWDQIIIQ